MAERKPFLLRVDAGLFDELRRWADDELRSVNGQIEFVLREALRRRVRLPVPAEPEPGGTSSDGG